MQVVCAWTGGWCLQVRGPIVLERYHKADGLCVDADNWFDTGDVASIDRFGVMKIQDRCEAGGRRLGCCQMDQRMDAGDTM